MMAFAVMGDGLQTFVWDCAAFALPKGFALRWDATAVISSLLMPVDCTRIAPLLSAATMFSGSMLRSISRVGMRPLALSWHIAQR
jgi:hypothetical protein